jgi:ferredoxin
VEYQCRSGYCGACRLKLVKGDVVYRQPPLAFINDGEILPCCCMPLTDIELEI